MSARLESAVSAPSRARTVSAHAFARVASIDVLRGLVIVLMALDHVRDFFTRRALRSARPVADHAAAVPDALDHALLRADVRAARGRQRVSHPVRRCTRAELSRFLLTRGLWLVVLEVTVVSLAWTFNLRYDHGLFLQVIWAIGVSMIVLAALVHLPLPRDRRASASSIIARAQPARRHRSRRVSVHGRRCGRCCTSFGPIPHAIRRVSADSVDRCHERSATASARMFDIEPQRRAQRFLYLGRGVAHGRSSC